jgi:predicted DNA-binding protein (MmcQ/YjbR family)
MNIEELRDYCISKPAVSETFPFDESTLVFKVAGKMFLLTDLVDSLSMNIKNTPEKVLELLGQFPDVLPGYHMNKKYWVTVVINGSITDNLLKEWIDESYNLVISGFSRKEKLQYFEMSGIKLF